MRGISEWLLAAGFLCAVLGAGLCQFVMIGLLGLLFFPVAFGLLVFAFIRSRSTGSAPLWQQSLGTLLHIMGVLVLLGTAFYASSLAFELALSSLRGRPGPALWSWLVLGLAALVPALLITFGLRCGTSLPWIRCQAWGAAAWLVVPATLVLFLVLSPVLPLDA